MLSDYCLFLLSVTLVYCGETVEWIKMKLGIMVGLGPGQILLDGDAALPAKGAQPPIFGPCPLCPNGWMDEDAPWCGGRPRPTRLSVRLELSFPPKTGIAANFRPMSIVENGWMDQDATWYGGRPHPRQHCVRWGPSPPQKGHSPQFLAHVCCSQNSWMDQGATEYRSRPHPRRHCVLWGPSPPWKGAQQPPTFGPT